MERCEVVVVGAGAAGLACAGALADVGARAVVLERAEVGSSWAGRHDRLRLNTVRWMSGLPGRRVPRAAGRWVARDDYTAYLRSYATGRELDVRTSVTAQQVDRTRDGWVVSTDSGTWTAGAVVVATGYDHTPVVPDWPGRDGWSGELVHAARYQSPQRLSGRSVLVAGAGASGLEIAVDLAREQELVEVAVRTPPVFYPRERLGLALTPMAWASSRLPVPLADAVLAAGLRLAHGPVRDLGLPAPPQGVATRLRDTGRGPIVVDGLVPALRAGRVRFVPAVQRLREHDVVLADGQTRRPDVLIAATGYRRALEGLVGHLGVLDPSGRPRTRGGRPLQHAPGLHFAGYELPLTGQLPEIARTARAIARRHVERPSTAGSPRVLNEAPT